MARNPDHIVLDLDILDLIDRYQKRDQEAFVKLAHSCSKPVWLYIRSKVNPVDADDLFQEFQIGLALYIRRGNEPITTASQLQRLAIKIGKCTVASFYRAKERKKNRAPSLENSALGALGKGSDSISFPSEPREHSNLTQRLLLHSGLTPAQRDAVIFVFLLDQTKRKAAKDLGICEKSLRERLEGAFRKFRVYLIKERYQ